MKIRFRCEIPVYKKLSFTDSGLINTVTIFVFQTWTSAVSFLFYPILFGMLKKYHNIWITLLMLKVLSPESKHLEVLMKLYKF